MGKCKLTPDYVFESSWEVCNKVGGIYTVLSTRAKTLQEAMRDRIIFIGPDFGGDAQSAYFSEDESLFAKWRVAAAASGLKVRVGRWLVPGEPVTILVDFKPYFSGKDELYGWLWEHYGVDSLHAYGDYDEASMFSYAAALVVESFYKTCLKDTDRVVYHGNEWMTGLGLLYINNKVPQIGTLFTTHATSIGRSIAGNMKPLYDYLFAYNGDQMAGELNMQSKHSIEKQTAWHVDCFTTVSEITANECKELLDKEPDVVLPNGFDNSFVPAEPLFTEKRALARKRLLAVASALLGECLGDDTLIVSTSGRYEFRNKGVDGLIVVPCEGAEQTLCKLASENFPLVLLDREVPGADLSSVVLNNRRACGQVTDVLVRQGFRRIEMISYSMNLSNIREREEGYRTCMAENGLGEYVRIHHLRHDRFDRMADILSDARQRRVEAFVFATNTLALQGVMIAFRQGWQIPRDFSMVCFDTNEAFDLYHTAAACVSQPIERFGAEALDLLLKGIEHRDQPMACTRVVLTPEILEYANGERVLEALSAEG